MKTIRIILFSCAAVLLFIGVRYYIVYKISPELRLKDYYKHNKNEFITPLQIRVFHIMAEAAIDDINARKNARKKISHIYSALEDSKKKGEFTLETIFSIADEISKKDPSGKRWGDLGWFSMGKYPEEFDSAVFGIRKSGDYVMFETYLGWHIAQLMNIRKPRLYEFEEVRNIINEKLKMINNEFYEKKNTHLSISKKLDNMVLISGGTFYMGSNEEEISEQLRNCNIFVGPYVGGCKREWFEDEVYHKVSVKSFYIDKYEVTIGQYKEFVKATGHRPLPDIVGTYSQNNDSCPVVCVSLDDAKAYAKWIGKRLPTAEEWEFCARGTQRRRFPWGNSLPDGTKANYCDASSDNLWKDKEHNDGYKFLAPIGSYPLGATPEGVFDMAGNAREWTSSTEPGSGRSIVKGGSFNNAITDLTGADYRLNDKNLIDPMIGFRCAGDLK